MKLKELFEGITFELKEAGIENPRFVTFTLLESIAMIEKHKVFVDTATEIDTKTCKLLFDAVKRLKAGEPLDYIIGWKYFLGAKLNLDSRVLIPRPETEELVEMIINEHKGKNVKAFADVGTGSGAIAIALAKHFPASKIYATDISKPALELAFENAKINGVEGRIAFLHGKNLNPLEAYMDEIEIIVSNPPYVKTTVLESLDKRVKDYEPIIALDGGEDGMNFFREFIKVLPEGKFVYLEIATYSRNPLKDFLKKYRKRYTVKFRRDLSGKIRFAILRPEGK
ncbi:MULTISPECIES: peptide chain release factor N(5)-glutamine methyltransferase [Kosmotoga]|uniref:peptide chain release factor N(5)-glutamine methyltransferase n=1 Tax=Kosmotoga olearia (strain ATCC BAA-1733 / DSM 21960 / TBF 19.5.1) TaxID=521045 RepID=C5CGD0_KOSOT|nr:MULTISPECIES: peptide chain release factor N(5)-glutamine methyltransferase [Kosmotoga]ACR79571.1 modification methylase, HemK family [Kosmotoga olearia TBF 19.5.1]MDI3523915.1 release factor glutamine methyltransferase [Kosmotoga sp.]MDK2953306.1 release factor glutamine methyltransferase [Kosmotoga sp.]